MSTKKLGIATTSILYLEKEKKVSGGTDMIIGELACKQHRSLGEIPNKCSTFSAVNEV